MYQKNTNPIKIISAGKRLIRLIRLTNRIIFVNLLKVFSASKKHILIVTLVILDILLFADIYQKKEAYLSAQIEAAKATETEENVLGVTHVRIKKYKTLTPTKKTTPTVKKSPTPTKKVSNTNGLSPTPTSAILKVETNANNDLSTSLLEQVNKFRTSNGKSPVTSEDQTCNFANTRAGEIVLSFNHDGFRNRIDSKTLPYPSYSSVAENIAMNSDSSNVIPGWINSSGHAQNLLRDVPHGCIGINGRYYTYEAWKP